jgi:hypothetical protein
MSIMSSVQRGFNTFLQTGLNIAEAAPETISNLQKKLSIAQATPIAGPILASPVKAVVSVAQVIISVAGAILLSPLALTQDVQTLHLMTRCFDYTKAGACSFVYAASNMLSLGMVGNKVQSGGESKSPKFVFYDATMFVPNHPFKRKDIYI